MSTETIKTSTVETSTPIPTQSAGLSGTDVLLGVLKIAGLAFTAYKAASHHKQQQQSAALSASLQANERPSMASIDPNLLLNIGLQHMRNMNRPMMK